MDTETSLAVQAPQENPTTAIINVIERAARDSSIDVDKMERLLAMQERVLARDAQAAFNTDFAHMQAALPVIGERGEIKDRSGKVQSRYALFEDINDQVKPILQEHGFAISFRTGFDDKAILVTGVLTHRAGHREETTIRLPLDDSGSKNNVQGVGSSTSYGKRYTLCALLNITTRGEDDDGRAAAAKRVSKEQAESIIEALGGPGERVSAFCKRYGLANVFELDSGEYDKVMAIIRKANAARG